MLAPSSLHPPANLRLNHERDGRNQRGDTLNDATGSCAAFVVLVGSAEERECTHLLIESIRAFGGVLSPSPVWLFEADSGRVSCAALAQPGVEVLPLVVPPVFKGYPLAAKVFACAQAEAMAGPGVRSLVWLNPECLIVRPPVLLDLEPPLIAAVRPVHIRNVGLPAEAPQDDYWKRVYAAVGVDDVRATVESFVDAENIRAYFNTHVFAVDPSKGLLRRWLGCFESLLGDEDFQSGPCRDGLHRAFLHQAVFSTILATALDSSQLRVLPPDYSYPYNLHQSVPPGRRAKTMNDLTCVVYEGRSVNPQSVSDIAILEPLRSWLAEHANRPS